MFGSVLISSREWLLPAAGFFLLACAILAWTYFRAPAGKSLRMSCAGLKLLGFGALVACLLEPMWSAQRARPGANFLAVVADNSQGMTIRDHGAMHTRGEGMANLLTDRPESWLAKVEQDFQVRRFYFDSRLQSTRDFSELAFDGRASSIGTALRTLADRFRGQPIAGVLLLTDGNATDLPDGRIDTTGLPPIYPVVIGSDDTINDITIQKIAVSQTSFEDAPVTIQADALADGYSGRMIAAQLLDENGRKLHEDFQRPGRGSAVSYRFQLRPEKSGVAFYQVRVSARDELEQFAQPETTREATLANNTRVVVVDRGKGPYRILYLSGRPNWEFKFLNRALAEDDQVELVGLIRIAQREPKFEFRGRAGESSNPLFRGFNRRTEETERYDQPVLIRLNTRDATELAGGFPRTAEDLFAYHAIILDDLEAEFFTRDQMALLQRFVSERGGGFLMLGGTESFHEGKYERTPIGEMLPVYLDFLRDASPRNAFRLQLTREGWLQPWARLRNTEAEEKTRLGDMPPFQVLNRARDVKPGASVIAAVQDETGKQHPALVAQRFGHGRVGALMIGDLWRWGLRDETVRRDMDRAWRQTIRWLISDVPVRVDIHAEPKRGDPNQTMTIQVRVRDKEFRPLDNAAVKITVTPIAAQSGDSRGKNSIQITAEPSLAESGLYEASYVPRIAGGYLAEASVIDADGIEAGHAQTGWASDPAAEEFRSLKPNRALLESIARQTGGEVVRAEKLDGFAAGLPNRSAPVTEGWSFPLWHQPWVFLFALGCFAAEWGLRRWKGMA